MSSELLVELRRLDGEMRRLERDLGTLRGVLSSLQEPTDPATPEFLRAYA